MLVIKYFLDIYFLKYERSLWTVNQWTIRLCVDTVLMVIKQTISEKRSSAMRERMKAAILEQDSMIYFPWNLRQNHEIYIICCDCLTFAIKTRWKRKQNNHKVLRIPLEWASRAIQPEPQLKSKCPQRAEYRKDKKTQCCHLHIPNNAQSYFVHENDKIARCILLWLLIPTRKTWREQPSLFLKQYKTFFWIQFLSKHFISFPFIFKNTNGLGSTKNNYWLCRR